MHRMKTSPEDVTVLLVGGGSIIAPDRLAGVAEMVRPPYFSVANAVGAAMAKGIPIPVSDVLMSSHNSHHPSCW